jgi:hypothetical protein
MHLGIVHDDGPDQLGHMEKLPRYGIIYTFSHSGNCDENSLVGFKNGVRGITNRSYLRLDVVALDDDNHSDNLVKDVYGKIINPNDPENPNFEIIREGLACYFDWKNGPDSNKLIEILRTQLDQVPV